MFTDPENLFRLALLINAVMIALVVAANLVHLAKESQQ